MKKSILIYLLFSLVGMFRANAQTKQDNQIIVALNIGDKVPDMKISDLVNYAHPTLNISDFKGKSLLIDFWATYCTSCLHHFPLADSLQAEFNNDLQVLLVDNKSEHEKKDNILATLKRFDTPVHHFSLPSVINDTILERMFPHQSIPHYVWIDKDGIVRAITSSEELTRKNVIRFLQQQVAPKFIKKDFSRDQLLYTSEDLPLNQLQHFSMLIKGKIDGLRGGGLRLINDTARGIVLRKKSLFWMYSVIAGGKLPDGSDSRVKLAVRNPSKITYHHSAQSEADWERENFYNYDLVIPASEMDHLYDYVLDDLNRYTPYVGSFEKQKTFCWMLKKTDKADHIHTGGGERLNTLGELSNPKLVNTTMIDLCDYLKTLSGNAVILDQTGYKQHIDLTFQDGVKDMPGIQKELAAYGLKLYSSYEKIEMLVIKDK
ncbi:thioredoxin-like domain-containing protein [Mucilaginibacter sp. UYCu711]|uniref:TlpA family protein disulfide reductase n=1 Tax=Mucilaginibacter sp. UYCu711 TaxID=3156339 RepID=UPI003D247A05